MKKYAKVVLGLMIALCCVGALAACGNGNDIVGSWKFDSVTVDGKDYKAGDTLYGQEIVADLVEIEFKSDNTFTLTPKIEENAKPQSGSWEKLNDNTYKLTVSGNSMEATIKDGILSFGMEGLTYRLKK